MDEIKGQEKEMNKREISKVVRIKITENINYNITIIKTDSLHSYFHKIDSFC